MAARSQQRVTEVPETMTYAEVMTALRASRLFVDQLVADGDLTVYRIGRRKTLIDKESVLAFFRTPFNAAVVDQRQGMRNRRY